MLEGSSPDPEQPSVEPEATEPPAEEGTVVEEEHTAEQVEAIWKNRVSQKDRAHAAAEAALRGQVDELNRQLQGRQSEEQASMSDVEREKARADAAEQRAAEAERQRAVDIRTLKYAAAAESLDPTELAVIDEARLAALDARLRGDPEAPAPPPRVDPNTAPKRSSAPPAPLREKSVAELESDLKRLEPEYRQQLEQRG